MEAEVETGVVNVLSVGEGHIKLSFDPKDPAERIRASRIVKDMIRRGYALLVSTGTGPNATYQRAMDFDDQACEYILADFDPHSIQPQQTIPSVSVESIKAEIAPEAGSQGEPVGTAPAGDSGSTIKTPQAPAAIGRKGRTRRVPAEKARVNAVGRVAGG